jgi:CHAT domain-containing protein
VLRWCIGRRRAPASRRFLALGVGGEEDPEGATISFVDQARAIAERVGRLPGMTTRLLPAETTGDELLALAGMAEVIHLECHGDRESEQSPARSSFLALGDHLDAQQVAERRGQINAELVFLNACLSGSFRPTMKNEVGGFWQAFLVAGAASLVATLTKVDPWPASELVAGFYDHWLGGGLGRARALQAAQRAMLAAGRGPDEWATHIVIGDGG